MLAAIRSDRPLSRFVEQLNQFRIDRNDDARSARFGVQLAGGGEHGVADFFGIEPAAAKTPQQSISRILFFATL